MAPRIPLAPGGQDDLGAEQTEQHATLDRHRLGHGEDAAVTAGGGDEGEGDAGIAGGRLDDDTARLEATVALGGVDHGATDAVLHARERVEELELHEDLGLETFGDLVEAHERGVADGVEDAVIDSHGV
jgi:hypothetical protein